MAPLVQIGLKLDKYFLIVYIRCEIPYAPLKEVKMVFIKKNFGLLFVCVILFVMVNACEDQKKSDLEEMKAAYELSVKLYNSGDIDGYFSLIHDDVVYYLSSRASFLEGKKQSGIFMITCFLRQKAHIGKILNRNFL